MGVREPHALSRQPVEMGRWDSSTIWVVAANITVTEVVRIDDQNVRRIFSGHPRTLQHSRRKANEQQPHTVIPEVPASGLVRICACLHRPVRWHGGASSLPQPRFDPALDDNREHTVTRNWHRRNGHFGSRLGRACRRPP